MNFCKTALIIGLLGACEEGPPPVGEGPPDPCAEGDAAVISMAELFRGHSGALVEWTGDEVLEAYVNSSDREGNIFGSIYLQDQSERPGFGLQLLTDMLDTHVQFPPGTKVRLILQGLYLGRKGDGFAMGSRRDVFGNPTLDRLPAAVTKQHLQAACDPVEALTPRLVPVDSLEDRHLNTLVRLPELEVAAEYAERTFAEEGAESEVEMVDCSGGTITLLNSGYSSFYDAPLPGGNGFATGILLGSKGRYQLLLRTAADLAFDAPRCAELYPPTQSDRVLISELADPENEPGARFLELYNAGDTPLDLRGWTLQRYTNDNLEPGVEADLTGLVVPPRGTLVFSANPEVFEAVYGWPPDAVLRTNGPSDSNGDDNILLIDPFGEVTDIFGVPGEDGSGTAHEFEDGRAMRRPEIQQASSDFLPEQWVIYNDTGAEGTLNEPQIAPSDFSPGTHPETGG